jgi:uncharacterized membrane protein
MATPASIKTHPLHPMLIGIPVGLFVFSLVSDIIHLFGWGGPVWLSVAYYTMYGGVIGALIAAIPGFIDYFSITDQKTKRTGTQHMIANLVVVALFIINLVIRGNEPASMALPFILSIVAVSILGFSGWKGWDMVYEHGMAVGLTADGKLEKGRPRPYRPKQETLGTAQQPRTMER